MTLIEQRAGTLSASRMRLARQLLASQASFAFSIAAEVARQGEVSEATVVRFEQEFGFTGYPAFPRNLQGLGELLPCTGERGIRRIVVTDSPFSALRGETAMHAPAEAASFVAFHAAPLIPLKALIEQAVATDREAARRALAAFEAAAESGGYFLNT